jgi:hypothetical protein
MGRRCTASPRLLVGLLVEVFAILLLHKIRNHRSLGTDHRECARLANLSSLFSYCSISTLLCKPRVQ